MAEYTDLATLKTALGITDTARDDLLSQAIAAASASIDARTGRTFGRAAEPTARVFRVTGRSVRRIDGELLLVDDIATDEGLTVEVGSAGSWMELDPGEYEIESQSALDRGRPITGLLAPAWLARTVRVTAVWGWPDVPDDIAQAALLQAARLYRRKDSPEGVAGSAEWGLIRVPYLDPDVRALVDPYRIPGFGGA